jgi:glycosyltransferase involved in cell wall biosynthesis
MKVLLDAQPLLGPRTGIGRYVASLIEHLDKPQEIEVFLAFNRIIKNIDATNYKEMHSVLNSRYPYNIIRRLMKPNALYKFPFDRFTKEKFDVFHGTNFTILPTVKAKSVVTVHDLAYMIYPETTSDKIYHHHSKWVPYSVQKADRVIADSYQTQRDLIRLLNIPEGKIDVVHLAGNPVFRPMHSNEYEHIYNQYSLPEKYILYVGTVEPRKNLITLIKAFSQMKRESGTQEKLVIVGAKGWKFSPIFELIQDLKMEHDIIFTGYVSDEDLVAIYNGALCFVLPSIYEGFGLPLLEAMQCGLPVLASNVSSIPEVMGDAGILVDPMDINQWSESLGKVIINSLLRDELASKSLDRAKQFTWEKVANQTIEVYYKALKG